MARRIAERALAGQYQRLPHRGGHLPFLPNDLYLVAVLQFGQQRRSMPVDLGADGGIADIGVDGIGEIDRGRPLGQGDEASVRREAKDLIEKQFELGMLQEFLRRAAFRKRFNCSSQPLESLALACQDGAVAGPALLVEHVRGDPVAGDIVHRFSAHLKLHPLPTGSDDRRVDRAIIIGFGVEM